ncbi:tubby C-terminal-like domain-containing protein [Aspergillus coremiiformis]|uniref:Tubby C-terminal-like domain-containing protein n=1 Tax=Aspergillus coremiiformis TaxID=138285 RepID=A0A5N6Z0Q2_9EURO|nr:tubby C-terminal-like domain-containing protein [Aspergillus coremiiformis]
MPSKLPALKQPIAIRSEQIASDTTVLRVKQHTSLSAGDFTISQCTADGDPGNPRLTTLFSVDGHAASWRCRRDFRDASGLPLFELHRKGTGVTWFVQLPGNTGSAKPIATLAPRWSALKDKFDVCFTNAAAGGEEVVLEVRGQDIWKMKTNVYFNGSLVMTTRVMNVLQYYVPFKRPQWEVEVAQGLDLSLVSLAPQLPISTDH